MRVVQKSTFGRGAVYLMCSFLALIILTPANRADAQTSSPPNLPGVRKQPLDLEACPLPCELSAALAGEDLAVLYYDYSPGAYQSLAIYSKTPDGEYPWSIAQTIEIGPGGSDLMAGNESSFFLGASVYQKRDGTWFERQVLDVEGRVVKIATWGPLVTYLAVTEGGSEVFVYRQGRFGRYNLEARLPVEAPNASSLAVGFGTIVVGAPEEDDGVGVAYAFTRGLRGWSLDQTLVPSQVDAAGFGRSVAVNARWLAIGAPETGGAPADGSFGEVYMYRRNRQLQWVEAERFQDPHPLDPNSMWSRRYGDHLAFYGPWLLIAARGPGYDEYEDPQLYLAHVEQGTWSTVAQSAFWYTYGINSIDMNRDYAVVLTAPKRGSYDVNFYSLTELKREIFSSEP